MQTHNQQKLNNYYYSELTILSLFKYTNTPPATCNPSKPNTNTQYCKSIQHMIQTTFSFHSCYTPPHYYIKHIISCVIAPPNIGFLLSKNPLKIQSATFLWTGEAQTSVLHPNNRKNHHFLDRVENTTTNRYNMTPSDKTSKNTD